MNKLSIRAEMKEKRLSAPKSELEEKSRIISERFCETEIYKSASCIAVYLPIKNEADLSILIKKAFRDKKRVFTPITDDINNDIYLSEIFEDSRYVKGAFGIREPEVKKRADKRIIDLILVPGLAFDFSGGRVGWGKGYYDRLIDGMSAISAGIGYEFQLLGAVPAEVHDCKMDYILTESELVVCG